MKKYILAITHLLPHLLCSAVAIILALYFQVEALGASLLAVFFTLMPTYIDKVREIGQLEDESRSAENSLPPQTNVGNTLPSGRPGAPPGGREAALQPPGVQHQPQRRKREQTTTPPAGVPVASSPAVKPLLIFAGIAVLGLAGWCLYLYLVFYP